MTTEEKAKAWDELNKKIAEFYDPSNDLYLNGDLCMIGEVTTSILGYA